MSEYGFVQILLETRKKGLHLTMLSLRGCLSVRLWICIYFIGNEEKVTSYNALIEGAVYIHLETRKVLLMHLIMLSSGDA